MKKYTKLIFLIIVLLSLYMIINKNLDLSVYTGNNKNTYIIELDKFNINNNNKNARDTTIGINNALKFSREIPIFAAFS